MATARLGGRGHGRCLPRGTCGRTGGRHYAGRPLCDGSPEEVPLLGFASRLGGVPVASLPWAPLGSGSLRSVSITAHKCRTLGPPRQPRRPVPRHSAVTAKCFPNSRGHCCCHPAALGTWASWCPHSSPGTERAQPRFLWKAAEQMASRWALLRAQTRKCASARSPPRPCVTGGWPVTPPDVASLSRTRTDVMPPASNVGGVGGVCARNSHS